MTASNPVRNVDAETIVTALGGRREGAGWKALCPAHADSDPSLSVQDSDKGVLVHCFVGCDQAAVVAALRERGLWPRAESKPRGEKSKPSATWRVCDAGGNVIAIRERYDTPGKKKKVLWSWVAPKRKAVDVPLYRTEKLPELPGATVVICEGEKAADAAAMAAGYLALGTFGVDVVPSADVLEDLRGRHVILWPDADNDPKKGLAHMQAIAARLGGIAKSIRWVDWGEEDGDDAADALGRHSRQFVGELLVEAGPAPPSGRLPLIDSEDPGPPPDGRPTIMIGTDRHRVVDESIVALAADTEIFQRGGLLSRIVHDLSDSGPLRRAPGTPRLVILPDATLSEKLTAVACWKRITRNEDGFQEIAAHPPDWAVRAVSARGSWKGIAPIKAIAEAPMLREDGTVLSEPGYDAATNLFLSPTAPKISIPENPTSSDAGEAAGLLLSAIRDFPFESDRHRVAALAAILTPFARGGYEGCAPLFLIDANQRGSGKTLLADVVGNIASGRDLPRMAYSSKDDEEMRKRITALALAGDPMVLLDNVVSSLGSPSLDAAITGTTWKDRILGQSAVTPELPLCVTWFATGNNVALGGDTGRRTLYIRLRSDVENPEEREGFAHPNLRKWLRQERANLVGAALTILRAYCVAGRPDMKFKPWGSFEGWSDLVRSAIVWCGLPDPCLAREEIRIADVEDQARRELVLGWQELDPEGSGVTVSEMLHRLDVNSTMYERLRGALTDLVPVQPGRPMTAKAVAGQLRKLRGSVVSGVSLDCRQNRDSTAVWSARRVV